VKQVEIKEVIKKQEWNLFLKLPWHLYKNDPLWVPPLLYDLKRQLNPRSNPFFQHGEAKYWIALKGGNCVGRIAAIIDHHHNAHYSEKTGFWGFFESIDDTSVSNALLDAAHEWLEKMGMRRGRGPVNLSVNNECGFLIEGFDRSPIMQMSYNPAYYADLLENYGYTKEHDLFAYYISDEMLGNERIMHRVKRISDLVVQRENITFRCFDTKDFGGEVEKMRLLFNDYLSDCWGILPMTKDEAEFMAKSLRPVLIKELALFAESGGKTIGCLLSLPDINQILKSMNGKLFPFGIFQMLFNKHKMRDIRVMFMGINKSFRRKGLEAVFIYKTIIEASKRKFKGAEMSWVSETNPGMVHELENLHAKLYKRYRVYGMPLTTS
jgi:hypothetical protein